jgi:hypothetical protein
MGVENTSIFPEEWSLINNLYERKVNYTRLIYMHTQHIEVEISP